jgi:hypothetical protein
MRQGAGLWLPLAVLAVWALGQAVLTVCGVVLGVAALPAATQVMLPLLPGLVALPLLVAQVDPAGWGGWLALLALNAGLTVVGAGLAWGCVAGWWAARETNLASSGLQAG